MPLFDRQRSRQRRVDPRKLKGDRLWSRAHTHLSQPRNLLKVVIVAVLCGGAFLLLHIPYEPLQYREGDVVPDNVFARVDFSYVDPEATQMARDDAKKKIPNVYEHVPAQTRQLTDEFLGLLAAAVEAVNPAPSEPEAPAPTPPGEPATLGPAPPPASGAEPAGSASATTATAGEVTGDVPSSADKATEDAAKAAFQAAQKRDELLKLWNLGQDFERFKVAASDPAQLEKVKAAFQAVAGYVDSLAILREDRYISEGFDDRRTHILIYTKDKDKTEFTLRDKKSGLVNPNSKSDVTAFLAGLREQVKKQFTETLFEAAVQEKIVARFEQTLAANLLYSKALTEDKAREAADLVKDKVLEFRRGDLLVQGSDSIGATKFKILKEEHDAYVKSIRWWTRLASIFGSAVLLGLLTFILIAYTKLYQPNVTDRVVRAFILVALFLVVMVIAKFFHAYLQRSMVIFPLTTAAMIVTIAYNRRFALLVTWVAILMVTLITRLNDYDVVVLLVVGTSVSILQLDEVRSRKKLIQVGLVTGLVYFLTIWGLEMVWGRELNRSTLERSSLALLAGLSPGFFILGLLPFIEPVFNVVTSLSLLELCDADHRALRKLAIAAPGTYSHSLLLGSLVEPACETIGANGLLARVGAYFHDIGKANKPQYFIENRDQLANPADHNGLTPQMSKLIITSHIKDGLDMARQYGLPRAVNVFIAEHHGTTVIEYFYQAALRAGEQPVGDSEFRYPGPKPQSKETAVLMMADSCEGAVRSIREPTPARIEERVHDIIMKRLLDGQFDESGLTFDEVRAVEQSLTKSLMSVYHGRIAYPESGNGAAAGQQAPAYEPPPASPRAADREGQPRPDAQR